MDVDAFLAWAEGREGRWELRDGQPVMMAPERALHALTKYAAQESLKAAIRKAGLPCRMFPNGMTVRITRRTAYEPDALVCPFPADLKHDGDPEPGHRRRGPIAAHGGGQPWTEARRLFCPAERGPLSHSRRRPPRQDLHKRGQAGAIETRVVCDGIIRLDPPGLEAEVAGFFAAE